MVKIYRILMLILLPILVTGSGGNAVYAEATNGIMCRYPTDKNNLGFNFIGLAPEFYIELVNSDNQIAKIKMEAVVKDSEDKIVFRKKKILHLMKRNRL